VDAGGIGADVEGPRVVIKEDHSWSSEAIGDGVVAAQRLKPIYQNLRSKGYSREQTMFLIATELHGVDLDYTIRAQMSVPNE
jgi:hypothetical protein